MKAAEAKIVIHFANMLFCETWKDPRQLYPKHTNQSVQYQRTILVQPAKTTLLPERNRHDYIGSIKTWHKVYLYLDLVFKLP